MHTFSLNRFSKTFFRQKLLPVLPAVLLLFFPACQKAQAQKADPTENTLTVLHNWTMPTDLREISGHAFYGSLLAAIEDEDGIIYLFNPKTGVVERRIPFGAAGDYEGIAIVGETAWVLRSDGVLFEVKNFANGTPTTQKHTTFLQAGNNTEGLFYDRPNNRLLVSVKDQDPKDNSCKGVYAYDLRTGTMAQKPVWCMVAPGTDISSKHHPELRASEIALQPTTNTLYALDGPANRLYVLDADGQVRHYYKLDKDAFPQPEGLAFATDGTLYISTEGNGGNGAVLKVRLEE